MNLTLPGTWLFYRDLTWPGLCTWLDQGLNLNLDEGLDMTRTMYLTLPRCPWFDLTLLGTWLDKRLYLTRDFYWPGTLFKFWPGPWLDRGLAITQTIEFIWPGTTEIFHCFEIFHEKYIVSFFSSFILSCHEVANSGTSNVLSVCLSTCVCVSLSLNAFPISLLIQLGSLWNFKLTILAYKPKFPTCLFAIWFHYPMS